EKENREPEEPREPPPFRPPPFEPHAVMIAAAASRARPPARNSRTGVRQWPPAAHNPGVRCPTEGGVSAQRPRAGFVEGLKRSVPVRLGILWLVAVLVLAAIAAYLYYEQRQEEAPPETVVRLRPYMPPEPGPEQAPPQP